MGGRQEAGESRVWANLAVEHEREGSKRGRRPRASKVLSSCVPGTWRSPKAELVQAPSGGRTRPSCSDAMRLLGGVSLNPQPVFLSESDRPAARRGRIVRGTQRHLLNYQHIVYLCISESSNRFISSNKVQKDNL